MSGLWDDNQRKGNEMEILLDGRFGRSYGWKHQISSVRTPVITPSEDGPYCSVLFYKR